MMRNRIMVRPSVSWVRIVRTFMLPVVSWVTWMTSPNVVIVVVPVIVRIFVRISYRPAVWPVRRTIIEIPLANDDDVWVVTNMPLMMDDDSRKLRWLERVDRNFVKLAAIIVEAYQCITVFKKLFNRAYVATSIANAIAFAKAVQAIDSARSILKIHHVDVAVIITNYRSVICIDLLDETRAILIIKYSVLKTE